MKNNKAAKYIILIIYNILIEKIIKIVYFNNKTKINCLIKL